MSAPWVADVASARKSGCVMSRCCLARDEFEGATQLVPAADARQLKIGERCVGRLPRGNETVRHTNSDASEMGTASHPFKLHGQFPRITRACESSSKPPQSAVKMSARSVLPEPLGPPDTPNRQGTPFPTLASSLSRSSTPHSPTAALRARRYPAVWSPHPPRPCPPQ